VEEGSHMPYADGRSPTIGDRVKNTKTGKIGTVMNIVLGVPSMQGRDQLTVKWDDGGFVAVSAADEYEPT
jgi:hypothetical protein